MAERTPSAEESLVDNGAGPTTWEFARTRLENPEKPRTCWLATVRPDGRPHVMPLIGAWIEGDFYFLSGDATRKARNLAGDFAMRGHLGDDDASIARHHHRR